MGQQQVNFGIIGAGEIARACMPAFKNNSLLRAVAVADVDKGAAQRLAAELGAASVYSDYRELLKAASVQAVYIATPPFLHKRMLLDCLAAGKHIICEKPFAMNTREVREIAEASEGVPGLKVACCSSRFLQLGAIDARRIVQSGSLGKLDRIGIEMSRPGI